MENLQFVLQRGAAYNGNFPDLTHIVFLLELIVANPPLFDRNHPFFGDVEFKFKVWNEICAAWYKKGTCLLQSLWLHFIDTQNEHNHSSFRSELLHQFQLPMPFCRTIATSHFQVSDTLSQLCLWCTNGFSYFSVGWH